MGVAFPNNKLNLFTFSTFGVQNTYREVNKLPSFPSYFFPLPMTPPLPFEAPEFLDADQPETFPAFMLFAAAD